MGRLSIIKKSILSVKTKQDIFHNAAAPVTLYRFTTWALTKRMEKTFDGNNTRMLLTVLNKILGANPLEQKLYDHLPSISQTNHVRRRRHTRHCLRSQDELIINVL